MTSPLPKPIGQGTGTSGDIGLSRAFFLEREKRASTKTLSASFEIEGHERSILIDYYLEIVQGFGYKTATLRRRHNKRKLISELKGMLFLELSKEIKLPPEVNPGLERARYLAEKLAHSWNHSYALNYARGIDLALALIDFAITDIVPTHVAHLIAKTIILLLEAEEDINKHKIAKPHYVITLDEGYAIDNGLTPSYFCEIIIPYIDALVKLQHVVDEMQNQPLTEVRLLGIYHGTVTVDLTGGLRDTANIVLDLIIPWRRQNQKKLAEIETIGKEFELKQKEVEIEQIKSIMLHEGEKAKDESLRSEAESAKILAEAKKLEADTLLIEAQARELAIKNRVAELKYMDLALAMIDKMKPNMSESERFYFAMKVVDPMRLLATSPLEIVNMELVDTDVPSPIDESSADEEE